MNYEIDEKITMDLTTEQAGRLIGYGGVTIKDLRKRFKNTKIDINSCGKRTVCITGKRRVNVYCLIKTQIL